MPQLIVIGFRSGIVNMLREVCISCISGHCAPHGYIALVAFSEDKFPGLLKLLKSLKTPL